MHFPDPESLSLLKVVDRKIRAVGNNKNTNTIKQGKLVIQVYSST